MSIKDGPCYSNDGRGNTREGNEQAQEARATVFLQECPTTTSTIFLTLILFGCQTILLQNGPVAVMATALMLLAWGNVVGKEGKEGCQEIDERATTWLDLAGMWNAVHRLAPETMLTLLLMIADKATLLCWLDIVGLGGLTAALLISCEIMLMLVICFAMLALGQLAQTKETAALQWRLLWRSPKQRSIGGQGRKSRLRKIR